MSNPTGAAPSRRERRYRRFKLRYPVHVWFHSGETVLEVDTVSRNVSTGGLLLDSPVAMPQQSTVSFMITVTGRTLRPLKLAGEGSVTRVEQRTGEMGFGVAIACTAPISRIESYLPTAES